MAPHNLTKYLMNSCEEAKFDNIKNINLIKISLNQKLENFIFVNRQLKLTCQKKIRTSYRRRK